MLRKMENTVRKILTCALSLREEREVAVHGLKIRQPHGTDVIPSDLLKHGEEEMMKKFVALLK